MPPRTIRHALGILALLVAAGCATIGRPTVTQLTANPPVFMLAFPLPFAAGDEKEHFVVPAGFVTDLASIPRALWWWQGPHEGTMAPAIVHDFLYWEQPCSKDEADAVMYVAMKQVGMNDFSVNRVYDGIRTPLALRAWERNRVARTQGEPRFFSEPFYVRLISSNVDAKATLASLQADAIRAKGTARPALPLPTIKAVCRAALREFSELRSL